MNKELITKIIKMALTSMAEVEQYGWSSDFCKSKIIKMNESIRKEVSKELDFNNLNIETAKALGFVKYSESRDLYLIPLYLYKLLPIGLKLINIFGREEIVGTDNIDNDHRAGMLAYGIEIKGDN